jgi:hypothetical protein
MATEPFFMYDNKQHLLPAPGNIITGACLKYLLAFLCAKASYYALKNFYMGGGIEGELKTNRLLILPVPKPQDVEIEKRITSLVDLLLLQRQNMKSSIQTELELEHIVNTIYEFTEEEKLLIDQTF